MYLYVCPVSQPTLCNMQHATTRNNSCTPMLFQIFFVILQTYFRKPIIKTNSMNKRLLLQAVLIALSATMPAAMCASDLGVAIVKADGTVTEHSFEAIDRIEIGTADITVHHAQGEPAVHAMADIDRIHIGAALSSINEALAHGNMAVWPTLVTGTVNIAGAAPETPVAVYDAAGQCFLATKTDGSGAASIDMSKAAPGTYILSAAKASVKLIKK